MIEPEFFWKPLEEAGGARRTTARLVVRGHTDPDLTTVRSEAPTISRLGRQTLRGACFSHHWILCKGDVENCTTAAWQGL